MIYNRNPISKSPKVQQTCHDHSGVRQKAQCYGIGVGGVGHSCYTQRSLVKGSQDMNMSHLLCKAEKEQYEHSK